MFKHLNIPQRPSQKSYKNVVFRKTQADLDILLALILVVQPWSKSCYVSISLKMKLKLCILLVHQDLKHGFRRKLSKILASFDFCCSIELQNFRIHENMHYLETKETIVERYPSQG